MSIEFPPANLNDREPTDDPIRPVFVLIASHRTKGWKDEERAEARHRLALVKSEFDRLSHEFDALRDRLAR